MQENHSVAVEPEPVSVQVVKWFGLVPFSFQFSTRLATVSGLLGHPDPIINLRKHLISLVLKPN